MSVTKEVDFNIVEILKTLSSHMCVLATVLNK